MKNMLCFTLALLTIMISASSVSANSLGKNGLLLKLNDAYLIYSKGEMPYIDANYRTLIPLRVISDAINGKITWDQKKKVVQIEAENFKLSAALNEKGATINNKKINSDTSMINKNGTVLVPAKWIAEGLGVSLIWDANSKVLSMDGEQFFQKGPLERMNNEEHKVASFDPQIVPIEIGYGTNEGEEQLKITFKNISKNTYTNREIQDHLLVYISPDSFIEEGINGITNSDRSGIRLIDKLEPNKTYSYFLPVGRLDQKQLQVDTPQYVFIRYFKYQ